MMSIFYEATHCVIFSSLLYQHCRHFSVIFFPVGQSISLNTVISHQTPSPMLFTYGNRSVMLRNQILRICKTAETIKILCYVILNFRLFRYQRGR
jgi:hypothetical protein